MNHRLMLILIGTIHLMLAGCSHSEPSAASPVSVSMTRIASGPVAETPDTNPGGLWIDDQKQLEKLADQIFGTTRIPNRTTVLPEIDFAVEGVLFVWMGRKPTGGYALELTANRAEIKERTALVPVRRIKPPQGAMVTQMITAPYLMLRLGKGDFDTIAIVDPDGPERILVPVHGTR